MKDDKKRTSTRAVAVTVERAQILVTFLEYSSQGLVIESM